ARCDTERDMLVLLRRVVALLRTSMHRVMLANVFGCVLLCSRSSGPTGAIIMTNGPTIIPSKGPASQNPGATHPFICNLRGTLMLDGKDIVDRLPEAATAFEVEYDQLWGLLHKNVRSDTFSLNARTIPPQ
ncbi:hypothetical protein, partial [Bradyrhizobium sp. STM 3809]|uniref:hypothetical protein n=1 Tax=Bradyrhizobium sp. STM 3809 TaxID=551936 RepID=UPI001AEC19C9